MPISICLSIQGTFSNRSPFDPFNSHYIILAKLLIVVYHNHSFFTERIEELSELFHQCYEGALTVRREAQLETQVGVMDS